MPKVQTHRQADLEKRFKILRSQLYGRPEQPKPQVKSETSEHTYSVPTSSNTAKPSNLQSDIVYLRQDLVKILLLSSLAIGVQIILFFLLKNDVLKLNILF